jgi:uncharacterized BrkB/YihY/UPF0761 family membrane protein
MLLWLYLSALAILVGAELNAEIHHALPQRREESGGSKPIGPAADPAAT